MNNIAVSVDPMSLPTSDIAINRKREAKDVTWSNINFVAGKSKVLTDCWGEVKVGQVCAILGPSGAGKSSLLNVLAGRSSSASGVEVSGTMKVGGKEVNPVSYRKHIAYVMQDDSMLATTTPREALRFSANLRLPSTLTQQQIHDRVETLLEELGLLECADVYIGNAVLKGISGGQRKRTSVGIEIITEPTLLFLDEPTSGLDSFSAFNLVKLLNKMSANCAILCTIHQPSSEVFFLFNKVIYMKDGRIFYQGLVEDLIEHYAHLGYDCPENYNPSDFVMDLCQSMPIAELEAKQLFMIPPDTVTSEKQSTQNYDSTVMSFTSESSFFKQLYALTGRNFIDVRRDYPALLGRFGVTTILSLLYGLIFMNAGRRDNADTDNFNSHVGALSMVSILSMFGTAQSVLLTFPFERPMILREYVTGTYEMGAYFISKLFVELPLCFLQMIYSYILTYFFIGLRGNYIYFVLTGWILGLTSNSLAMMLGCAVPDVKSVTELSPLLFVPQILFGGFFIRTTQIPLVLRWANYLCGLKYAMNLQFFNEFHESIASCEDSEQAAENCAQLLEKNDISSTGVGLYIMALIILFVGYRFLGIMILYQKAKRFY